jgi:MFS family permease
MEAPSQLPLKASLFLAKVGHVFTLVLAIILLVLAILLALAWPQVMAEAVEQGMKLKVADIQPGVSLVLLGAAAILGLAARMFGRLSTILDSVAEGDPFTVDNSRRLRHIGWLMIAMQFVGLVTGWAGKLLPPDRDIAAGFDFSFSGLLAAFLAFVVAQLFEQARSMRDELEGTV